MKRVQQFGVKRKLAPRYVGPYPIIEKSGRVAYKTKLPQEMRAIFNVFHVSQLKKCLRVLEERVEVRDIKLKSDLAYEEKLVQIIDSRDGVTRTSVIKFHKVIWNNHYEQDATWERGIIYESFNQLSMKNDRSFKSRDEISIRGRGYNTLVLSIALHEHKHHSFIYEH